MTVAGDAPDYPRDLIGYGRNPPHANWPGNARIAVQFVMNYEEGGERSILHGDGESECYLQEVVGIPSLKGVRDIEVESVYEYGSRVGFWRIWREFGKRGLPLTVYAVATALARNLEAAAAIREAGWEVASHGLKWIDYQFVDEAVERAHLHEAVAMLTQIMGERPLGWYTGRVSPQTRRLVVEEGGFLYDADSYADDLPYWITEAGRPHLVVPYTLDNNDMKFGTAQGFSHGGDFFAHCRDAFDLLYDEGAERPKMMSIGLHCRLIGRPGRFRALQQFLDHIQSRDRVWITRRIDIARHWMATHPCAVLP